MRWIRAHIFSRDSSLLSKYVNICFGFTIVLIMYEGAGRVRISGRWRRACNLLPLFDADSELVESVCHDATNANDVPYRSVAARGQVALYGETALVPAVHESEKRKVQQRTLY